MKKIISTLIIIALCFVALAGFIGYMMGTEHIPATVKVPATAKLYETVDSSSPVGEFLGIFDDVKEPNEDLAKMIDEGGFPYEVTIKAMTTPATAEDGTTPPTRYLIQTHSGETYWVEP